MTTIHTSCFNDLSGSEIGLMFYALWHIYHYDKSLTPENRQEIKDLYNKLHGEDILQ